VLHKFVTYLLTCILSHLQPRDPRDLTVPLLLALQIFSENILTIRANETATMYFSPSKTKLL